MTIVDFLIAAAVLAIASWILLRSLRRSGGPCPGCSSGGCHRPPERGGADLVRLGTDHRRDA